MAQLYIYSNSAGTFVFNQNFFLIDHILFSDREIVQNCLLLEKGDVIEPEKKMLNKHKKGQFVVVGIKNDSKLNTDADLEKLSRITAALRKEGMLENIKHADTVITRYKISVSVNEDTFIVQAVNHIKELEKITNTIAKRLREWYSYYLPEFSESIQDHEKFSDIISRKSKDQLLKELRLKKDESMGAEFRKKDLEPMIDAAKELNLIYKLKERQKKYLDRLMETYCPNITAVAGPVIGAKLLAQAGSLKRLSEFPASTVQVLGAEEAFFRHMTTGSRPPKHGYIHEHPFIAQADKSSKGRIARVLADKLSIAAKVDYFKGEFVGDKLRKQVEAKLKTQGRRKKDETERI
ncbi:MAG: NOP58 family protein [Nanoarchaeota archaeon]|nr:NOP58 family protein [Nanoarchaeota archaeon]